MNLTVTSKSPAKLEVDLLLVPLTEDAHAETLSTLGADVDAVFQRAARDFDGAEDQTLLLYPEDRNVTRAVLIGLGAASNADRERLREAGARAADAVFEREAEQVAMLVPDLSLPDETVTETLTEGFVLGGYRYRRYKTGDDAFAGPQQLTLCPPAERGDVDTDWRQGARRGQVVAEATCTARDLVNRSPNEKSARELAALVEEAGRKHGYETTIWDEERIREEGMGGLLAVNRGSVEPPTFTILEHRPDAPVNAQPIVLVGKSVVFDTGGLSLKPTKNSMDYMKCDMGGGAAVIGAFEALARLELPLHVIGLLAATDNRPGKDAYVPGDVIRMHDGSTVEVMNTDAEGRLTMADALSHARSYDPELVVDLATLTGSSVVALGHEAAAFMTPEGDGAEDRLARFRAASDASGDRLHPLPLYDAYADLLDSDVADRQNVGGKAAGAITAGKFLEHFTDYPWAHLDIAGTAFLHEPKPYRPPGGTGYGVRLLTAFLRDYAG